MQGQIIISIAIGSEYVKHELPYKDYATGKTRMLSLGNFLSEQINHAIIRDSQAINILFTELLPYCITPYDRVFLANYHTIVDFLKKVKSEKE